MALDAGYEPVALLCERRHIDGDAAAIIERCADVPVYTGEQELLARLTGYVLTRGVLCAMRRPALPGLAVCGEAPPYRCHRWGDGQHQYRCYIPLGSRYRHGWGCCLRVAARPLNRRVVRLSMGSVFLVPWTWMDGSLGTLAVRLSHGCNGSY